MELEQGLTQVKLHFGFMQDPDVPKSLKAAQAAGSDIGFKNPEKIIYYVGGQLLVPSKEIPGMAFWREKLFAFMARNAALPIVFYGLPTERVIQLGIKIEL